MAQSAEDFNSEEMSLPKAKTVLHPRFSLKNLNPEQIVKLVGDFRPEALASGSIIASAFGPLADLFIDNLPTIEGTLAEQIVQYTKAWDQFCLEEIYSQFENLADQEGEKIRDEVLHYPLFTKRRVLELIRVKSPLIFSQLVCARPFSFYSVSQLWDPNHDVTSLVRDYYSILAQTYLSFYKTKITARSYFDFVNVVKSPYRDLYDISNDFEADYEGKKFRALYLKQLAAARTGAALKLRTEQLEGFEYKAFYMPAPLTIEAVSSLTLRWLSEQSLIFKNDLPAVLLEFILEKDVPAYKELISDLGRTLTGALLKGVEIGLDSEFPEFDQSSLCYKEISSLHFEKVNLELFASPLHRELLATAYMLSQREQEDKLRDVKRAEHSIGYLQGRRFYRPWEIRTLNQEIRSLQREVYQYELELKIQNKREVFLKSVVDQVCEVYPPAGPPLILQIADRACTDIKITGKVLDDPLMYSTVFSFANNKSKAEQVKSDLDKLGYVETKLKNIVDSELVDYLHIWGEIVAGMSLKKLRKEYTDFRVNRVLVEYEHKVNKKLYETIKQLEPKLSAMISLVVGREKLDHDISELADIIVSCSEQVAKEYFANVTVKDQLARFQLYSECVAIIWDWLTLQIENPYSSATAQKFQAWFERELCSAIREKSYDCYVAMSYIRPASVLGLEPGADFNWKDTEPFQEHVTILTEQFCSLAEVFSKSELLFVFARFKEGLTNPFVGFLNTKRYDLDLATDKILLIDASQKHLFTSQYRRDALSFWVKFHEQAFVGEHPFHGLFFELVMKELKNKHQELHVAMCLELVELERYDVSQQRERAYFEAKNNDSSDELINLIQLSTARLDFLAGLRRSLS